MSQYKHVKIRNLKIGDVINDEGRKKEVRMVQISRSGNVRLGKSYAPGIIVWFVGGGYMIEHPEQVVLVERTGI
jgi:hypothetical protein